MPPLKNYTTSVSAERTIGEIMEILAPKGAREILTAYDDSGQVSGLSWTVDTPRGKLTFRLPLNLEAVRRTLAEQSEAGRGVKKSQTTLDHARKVAWRTIKDWIDAQMALLETEQVEFEQIFLPYLVVNKDQDLYHHMLEQDFQVALPPGRKG